MRLSDLSPACFQGIYPSMMATSSSDGVPNVTYISQVFRIDDARVALSCQFFNKTKKNVLQNPVGVIELYDPTTFEAFRLLVRYRTEETSGPLYESMALRIDAIASQTGMKGIFRLRSADIYDVLSVERREGFLDGTDLPPPPPGPDLRARSELRGLQLVSHRTRCAKDLDELLATVLSSIAEAFGVSHGMVLMPDETGAKLFVVASRGYDDSGVGAEVAMGDGLIGTVARERKVLRMSGVESELRYGRAIRAGIQRTTARRALSPEIPLAGLPDAQSHMALPLVVNDELVGVLAVESPERMAFEDWHEAFLEIVANQVAASIQSMLLREREPDEVAAPEANDQPRPSEAAPEAGKKVFRYFRGEDWLFVGDEYLIRNVPAKLLWYVLREHAEKGRIDFTNRELRLDRWIGLPALRDNLESRLVLLRKRLEQKCPDLRLAPTGRGRFRLELDCGIVLEERAEA